MKYFISLLLFLFSLSNVKSQKVYLVSYENQADLKIYYVDYENQAGWNNSSKKSLLD